MGSALSAGYRIELDRSHTALPSLILLIDIESGIFAAPAPLFSFTFTNRKIILVCFHERVLSR